MIPLPSSRVFRSRWRALWWSLCVVVSALMFVGVGESAKDTHAVAAPHSADALGQPVDDKTVRDLLKALDGH